MTSRKLAWFLAIPLVAVVLCADARVTAAPRICKLAEVHPQGYPTELADEEFARLVAAKTNGAIRIQVCFNSRLGSEDEVTDQARRGIIEFLRVSTSPVVSVYSPIGVFSIPYVFRSREHMWKVLDGPIGQYFLEAMSAVGLVGIGYFDAGARNLYATKPLKRVSDLKGLKIRVQPSPIMIDLVKLLHATAVPIAYAEVHSALQTGVVDGAENNVPSWVSQNHYRIARYMIEDEHLRLPEILICSKKFFDTLTGVQKAAIREAAAEATRFQIKAWSESEIRYLDQAKAYGCVINKANVPEFQAALAPLGEMPKYADHRVWIERIAAVE